LTPEKPEEPEAVIPAPAPAPVPVQRPATKPVARKPAPVVNPLACAEMDYKNTQLSAQIVELEEKVKSLQAAIETAHASASAAAAQAATKATKPKAAKKKPEPEPVNWTLYGGIGGGLLALIGLVVFLLKRRKKAAAGEAGPGFFARFKKGKKEEVAHEEPVAEEPPAET
jgi:hypothetical protein